MTPSDFAVSRERLDALTDGLFAIAMTILVLELKAPDLPAGAGLALFREALLRQWPSMAGYVTSFALLGLFWYQHHWLTHALRRVDAPFLIVNLFFLLVVGSVPFTPALMLRLNTVVGGSVALVPYLACLSALQFSLAAMVLLALRRGLLETHAPLAELKRRGAGWLLSGICLLAAAGFMVKQPTLAPFFCLPILPFMLYRRWRARAARFASPVEP